MKIFRGNPGPPERVVTVEDRGGIRILRSFVLPSALFSWGDGSLGSRHLTQSLAVEVIGEGDGATKIYVRLMHRTVMTWQPDQPWMCTEAEIKMQIDAILQVERETAQSRLMVAREPAPVVREGGRDIVWDSAEDRRK